METEAVIGRIRKLLALADSNNPHEAALALARAQELAERHQLDMAHLSVADELPDVGEESIPVAGAYLWQAGLLQAVAAAAGARVFATSVARRQAQGSIRRSRVLTVVGTPAARRLTVESFVWLRERLEAMAQRRGTRKDRSSYLWGAVKTVGERLRALTEERRAKYTATERALVVKPGAQADAYLKAKYPRLRTHRVAVGAEAAYRAGRVDGAAVPLGPGISAQQRQLR